LTGNQKLHELVEANLRSLVGHRDLSDGDTETLIAALTQLREVACLSLQGIEGIEKLVRLLHEIEEHTETIHFLPMGAAIDPKQAVRYAQATNARLGGTFRYGLEGEVLSIDERVAASDRRVPINVINLSILQSPGDQAYAIAHVTSQIIEWMRQPGAQRPRLVYSPGPCQSEHLPREAPMNPRWPRPAENDLADILDSIAEDDPAVALGTVERAEAVALRLVDFPLSGRDERNPWPGRDRFRHQSG